MFPQRRVGTRGVDDFLGISIGGEVDEGEEDGKGGGEAGEERGEPAEGVGAFEGVVEP